MNRNLKFAIGVIICLSVIAVFGQTKPAAVIPAPTVYTLSAEATKELITLSQQRAVMLQRIAEIDDKQRLLLVGAQIPAEARNNCTLASGETQVVCTMPEKKP